MNSSEFEQFAAAVSAQKRPKVEPARAPYRRISVLGGGSDALLLAALCLAEGAEVTLFSAYGKELDALRTSGGVTLSGAGPVGVYQVDQEGVPSIQTTAELDSAVASAELIFLTGPVHKQRTYAMALADHIVDGQVLVLAPGRSLGAAEAAWLLRVGGARADFTLIETQGLPFWYTASGTTLALSPAGPVSAASLPSQREEAVSALQAILPNIEPAPSTVHSGFHDGSGLVEVPALLLGGVAVGNGLPEVPYGGVPLAENASFRALIGAEHERVIHALAAERHSVAAKFGVRDLPSAEQWIDTHAGAAKGAGARPVPDKSEAGKIVRCAIVGSLAPLASAARTAGIAVPVTESMITLASTVLSADIASAGRKLESVGIQAADINDARRCLDNIAQGVH